MFYLEPDFLEATWVTLFQLVSVYALISDMQAIQMLSLMEVLAYDASTQDPIAIANLLSGSSFTFECYVCASIILC